MGDRTNRNIGIGFRCGHLTVERDSGERRGRYVVWLCRCDCGGEIRLDTRTLQRGTVRDCGCESRVRPGQRDLTGERFGRLVCLEPTAERGKGGCVIWRCRCDCGKVCMAESRLLLNGNKKSCGCLKADIFVNHLKFFEGTSITMLETRRMRKVRENSSGYTGVYRNHKNGKWVAQITVKRKTYYLGCFERLEDAIEARRRGEERYGEVIREDDHVLE